VRTRTLETLVRGSVVLVAFVTLAAFALSMIELAGFVGQPVPGFAFRANGDVGPRMLTLPGAGPEVAALRPQDRVVAVDGTPVAHGRDVMAIVAKSVPGRAIPYTFERPGGERFDLRISAVLYTWSDAARQFGPFLIGGLLLVALSCLVAMLRPGDPNARAFFVVSASMGTGLGVFMVDGLMGFRLGPEWQLVGLALTKASVFHLALLWPVRRWPLTRFPRGVPVVAYTAMLLQTCVYRAAYFDAPRLTSLLAHVTVVTLTVAMWLLVANIARSAWSAPDLDLRRSARSVLIGPAVGVAMGVLLFVNTWFFPDWHVPPLLYLVPVWVTMMTISYSILRHNLFAIDTVARHATALGIQGFAVAGVYLVVFAAAEAFVGGAASWSAALLFAIALAVAVPAAAPLRRRAEAAASALFPRQLRAAEVIHRASRELVRVRGEDEVALILRDAIVASTGAEAVRVLIGRPGEKLAERGSASPISIASESALVAAIAYGAVVDVEDRNAANRALRNELKTVGATLLVPLPSGASGGAFLLGRRSDGIRYGSHDRQLLETLAAQSAVALENARAWEEVRSLEQRLSRENLYLREEVESSHVAHGVIGNSEVIRAALAQIERVAPTDATVLVIGETGTGKELAVRSLHALSRRKDAILVKVACAAIPESLIESELFGHEKGAFTGATQTKPGRFEVADGGTLFFDDVDTLPLGVQAKLLRAIQEGEVQRVGSNVLRHVDVRIVAATNKDLLAEVRAGRFREDLYYRLHVVPIRLPALRDRAEDIPLLVEHFVAREAPRLGRSVTAVAADAMEQLQSYAWPGNIRELRNVIERALVMTSGDVLRLPAPLRAGAATSPSLPAEVGTLPFAELVRRKKIEWIREALERSGGNQRRAAELLGLHRPSLTRMIRELGIRAIDTPGGSESRYDAASVGRESR
jgi:transcriptional regulator with GAF, ATPase, and Fis domain